jgi:DNA-binding HxlR family transcriptional regulator
MKKLSELGNTMRPIISAMETWGLGYQELVKNTPEKDGKL